MRLICENFEDRVNQILLAAALVSIIIGVAREGFPGGLIDGISIFVALTIICVVSSIQNYISERRLADLIALSEEQHLTVLRQGQTKEMDAK